jgi:hypothetical protein
MTSKTQETMKEEREKKTLRVKITSCYGKHFWYIYEVGSIYEVYEGDLRDFEVAEDRDCSASYLVRSIRKTDCVII